MMQRKTGNTIVASAGTSILWGLWVACLYYVIQDLRTGRFRTYMEADFWAVAGGGAAIFVGVLLAIVVGRKYLAIQPVAPKSRNRSEEVVLGEIFGLNASEIAAAKDMKNIHVNFTGADLQCKVSEVKVASRTAG
jgi:hypothetical protein